MLDDIFKSLQSHINERLSSPLMGSFVVSWGLWNYKFLVILFSAASVSETFRLINTLVFPDSSTLLLRGLLYPALTAAAYIFIYPYPARFVYKFSHEQQKLINDSRRRIEGETLLTLEESRKIRSEWMRIETEHFQEIDRKNNEIERLKAQLLTKISGSDASPDSIAIIREEQKKIDNIRSRIEGETTLQPTQLDMLRLIEKLGGRASEQELIQSDIKSKTQAEYDVVELEKKGLVDRFYEEGDAIFQLTHMGRKYLLEHTKD